MKKILLILTIVSHFVFGQNASSKYDAVGKKSHLQTGVTPKANVITYTDTSASKSPVWWFNTGRVKFKNSIVAIDTTDFDGILVRKGDSLLLADKNLIVIGATNGLTLSSGFAKIGGTLTDSTVINLNNRSFVLKTNSADVNKEVIKITDESDNIALIVNQSGKNVIALGKNAGSGTISAEDCNFLGENAGSGATDALFSNFMGKNAGLNSTTATHSNFFGQGAGSSAPLAGGSNFLGANAGAGATNAGNSNFLGQSAGNNAVNANGSNFLGYESGNGASNANGSNFLGNFSGSNSTNANNSNFFGFVSGRNATNAYFSNFIGPGSGDAAINANNSNFFGAYTGLNSTNASNSNFFGKYAGRNAINAANSIFIGTETGDSSVNLANSIVIGKYSGRKETLNTTTGGTSIQIGNYTHTGGFNNTIAIGDSATNTKTNQVVFAPKYRHLRLRGVDYELPSSQGGVDTYLKNNGSGVLSWATASGGGSGMSNALPEGAIWVGGTDDTAIARIPEGDVTINNLGVTRYNGIVPNDKITDSVDRIRPIVGDIINETWSNLTSWTKEGSQTFTVSGGNLNVVGGSPATPDFENYYTNTGYGYTMYNNWEVTIPVIVGTISSTSHGVCFGTEAKNAASQYDFQACLMLSTAKVGNIILAVNNGTKVDSTKRAISVSAGDTVLLKISRIYDNINTTITNISGVQDNANHLIVGARDFLTSLPPTIGYFAITGIGGNHTVMPITVTCNHKTGSGVVLITDSRGGSPSNIENSPALQLQKITGEDVDFCYSVGARIEDFPVTEINNLQAEKVVLLMGVNNVSDGNDTATVATKIRALTLGINGTMGVNKFYIDELPWGSTDMANYSYAIKRRLGKEGCIYAYNSFRAFKGIGVDSTLYNSDRLHLSDMGAYELANIIDNTLNLKKSNMPLPHTLKPFIVNSKIISTNGTSRPFTQLESVDIHGNSQLRISNTSSSRVGGYATSLTNNQFHVQGGYSTNEAGSQVARDTTGSGMDCNAGAIAFNTFTGATIGNTVVPSEKMRITKSGLVGIGTNNPIYALDVRNTTFATIRAYNSITPSSGSGGFMVMQSPLPTAVGHRMGVFGFGAFNGTISTISATIEATATEAHVVGTNLGTDLQFRTTPTGSATRATNMTLTGAGLLGVGTTAPASKISILGNFSVGATYATVAAPTSGAIIEGNVGIGTSSPSEKLSVTGNATVSGSATVSGYFTSSSGRTKGYTYTASNLSLSATHEFVVSDNTVTITLPSVSGITGRTYTIANSSTGNTITISSSSAFSNVTATPTSISLLPLTGKSVVVVATGGGWIVVNQ